MNDGTETMRSLHAQASRLLSDVAAARNAAAGDAAAWTRLDAAMRTAADLELQLGHIAEDAKRNIGEDE